MTVTRTVTRTEFLAAAEPDDTGHVAITLASADRSSTRTLTPDEARELATELIAAATEVDRYLAEQPTAGGA